MPILDTHAPLKTRKVRNPSAPPVTAATKDLMARRRGALLASGRDSDEYQNLNRAVRSAIRRDTRADITTRIKEQGLHTVWRNIRGVVAGKKPANDVLPELSPEELNAFFVSVGPRVAAEVTDETDRSDGHASRLPRVGSCGFAVSPTCLDTLTGVLFSMKDSPACGSDGVCVRALKVGSTPSVMSSCTSSIPASSTPTTRRPGNIQSFTPSSRPATPPIRPTTVRFLSSLSFPNW